MDLDQLTALRHWQRAHRRDRPVEAACCGLVFFTWVMGWASLPTLAVLEGGTPWLGLNLLACLSPTLYASLRRRLHRRHRLRCDWIETLRQP